MFDWKDLYVLIAAFAGAVIGGLFTLIAAHYQNKRIDKQIDVQKEITSRQIRADIILSNERNSINELRNLVAEYLSIWQEFTHKLDTEKGRINKDYYESTLRQVSSLSHKILLSLNREDIIEGKLYLAIHNSVLSINNIFEVGQMEKMGYIYEEIGEKTQEIIKNRFSSLYKSL